MPSLSSLDGACSARPAQLHPLFGCNKGHVTPHLLIQHVLPFFGDNHGVCRLYVYLAANKAAWNRKVLQDLQEETHFSSTELEVLLHHFQVNPQQLMAPVAAAVAAGCSRTVACIGPVLVNPGGALASQHQCVRLVGGVLSL